MSEVHCVQIADEMGIVAQQVRAVEDLLGEGASVPFVARYRKERTGSLDEVIITEIRDRLEQLRALDSRRESILKSLDEQGQLTDELRSAVESAGTMAELEDIYLPYRPKRRTRATIAREKGLEPLAQTLFAQDSATDLQEAASEFINEENGVASVDDALAGARDIIAEWVNEDAKTRQTMRQLFGREGVLYSKVVKGKDEEGAKYRDYFDWQESVAKVPGHRVLAMFRGEKEGYLKLSIRPSEEKALALLQRRFVKDNNASSMQVSVAVEDSYARLLVPSMETDTRQTIKERADAEALRVFANNLRETLMASPMGQKATLAIDPGYRTGCKVVCLDRQGVLLHNTTIYLEQSDSKTEQAKETILDLVKRFDIEAIAIGNGTASRETETFVRGLGLPEKVAVVMVNESGASVYSASEAAREEFPDYDLTVRGAVSIGRRLMDPLAELVKIAPKSIGVGQYQHDVDQGKLKTTLDDVVMRCVNEVGVEVNTASKQLLAYVSGLGPALAKNIVTHRNQNGPFRSRDEIKKVPRLGARAFEQAAGFLRIHNADNPLDASAVHPESYYIVERMTKDLNCTVTELMSSEGLRRQVNPELYAGDDVGLPTLNDIMVELGKPGRDPRERFEPFSFAAGITLIDHLAPNMRLPGIVTNVTNFGAFVDIGVHQDGLVHISELSDGFVKNPADIVRVNQKVTVTVLAVDRERNRISLSMKDNSSFS
ncbi:MAG: Tex family protein [Chloroflexota bacterium]